MKQTKWDKVLHNFSFFNIESILSMLVYITTCFAAIQSTGTFTSSKSIIVKYHNGCLMFLQSVFQLNGTDCNSYKPDVLFVGHRQTIQPQI